LAKSLQSALNWLVDNYPRLADWAASARRVASLELALDALERAEGCHGGRIVRGRGKDAALRLRDVIGGVVALAIRNSSSAGLLPPPG
jgi:putative ATP-binding cassette transporter